MAANKILNIEPVAVPNAAGNLLNCGITSLAGPSGYTQTQPYIVLKHIRLVNKTGAAATVTLYKGASAGSAAGTEFAVAGVSIPANSYVDWYGQARFDATDFLTGVASAANTITFNAEGEIGLS